MKGFITFIREQGVMGLAVGFLLGGSVSKVVTALVTDIINPLIGIIIGSTNSLADATLTIGSTQLLWGHFIAVIIDFIVVALVVYYGVKGLGLDKLDKKRG